MELSAITNVRVCSISKSRYDRNAKREEEREKERSLSLPLFILARDLSQQSGYLQQCLAVSRIPSGSWKCHFSRRRKNSTKLTHPFPFILRAQRRDAKANDARHGKLSPYRSNPLSWIPDTGMSHHMWVNRKREQSGQTVENLLGIWMVEENCCSRSKDNWQIRNK